ncbi:MAG: hypothetical protein A2X86_13000 [Bdellovibrionales bacterium GWA2_49_15]|nr:MAG: hypothetical protein A2X86_13000 [Bdellovibrionales bacterium GWA2_49_15]HAZ13903.1 hypothetical protein [Bdellovibrionales bacterium]
MKTLAIILIALGFSAENFAEVVTKPTKEPRITWAKDIKEKTTEVPVKKITRTKVQAKASELSAIRANGQKIRAILEDRINMPTIWEGDAQILTGKTYKGILLNSIVSSNLASPVLVRALPGQGLPYPTRFSCAGTTQNKRVLTLCNKMILPEKEVAISAQILNPDGSGGLIGEYDDGKEELIAGAVLSDFAQGMLSAAQTRLTSPMGEVRDSGVKNQLLQGMINSGGTTSDILLEEMKKAEPVVTVSSGTEVLIYFMEAANAL